MYEAGFYEISMLSKNVLDVRIVATLSNLKTEIKNMLRILVALIRQLKK